MTTIYGVTNSNSFRNPQKVKVLPYLLCCGSNFSIAHGGENDINRHKDTSKHKGYVDAAQQ